MGYWTKNKYNNNNIFNFLQDIAIGAPPPLSLIDIVKYCYVWGGGAPKSYKKIMAPPLSAIKIVKYCGVVVGGGGIGSAKILQT